MRWDRLFDDLQAQLDADGQRELELEVSDRTRRERAQVGLHERFVAHRGLVIDLRLAAGVQVGGTVADAGLDWLLVHDRGDRGSLVPFGAIVAINGLGVRAAVGPGMATAKRFGLGYALRGLSRNRSVVSLTDIGGSATTGTVDAVGADALDLSEHPADVARRAENIVARRVIPFTAIVVVRHS
ncbi:MAG TPA: hypothetical protein VES02_08200 [Dermatophilaceae bacterium]|jgi:hypothetical protein|nr:hypothetical protein [Dermatophilaceae bacterium]